MRSINKYYLRSQFNKNRFGGLQSTGNLKGLIKLLTDVIPIGYIFLIGPKQTEPKILIVLDQYKYMTFEKIEGFISFASLGFANIMITFKAYSTISDYIKQAHVFYSNLCVPVNCIYKRTDLPWFAKPNVVNIELEKHRVLSVFEFGSSNARCFLIAAETYINTRQFAMAAFMIHQACEQSYKMVLLIYSGKEYKLHDLKKLRNYTAHYTADLMGTFNRTEKKETEFLNMLQESYIRARYDRTYNITEEELHFFFNKVYKLTAVIRKNILNAISQIP